MHRRYEHINVPIEIVRTFVSVVEHGSFSKAGLALHLSQPAITAQMKRLQMMVGGTVFDRARGGTALSPRGTLVMTHAKRILQENDQLLSLGGATSDSQPIRVGLAAIFITDFLKIVGSKSWREQVTFLSAHSVEIEKNFNDGYLDVGCILNEAAESPDVVFEWTEPFVWVRSRNFVLSPGSPIPIVCWPGSPQSQPALASLESKHSPYRIVFSSYDYRTRLAAVAAGLGLMSVPQRHLEPPLVVAKEYYLPPLRDLCVRILAQKGLADHKAAKIIELLKMLRPGATPNGGAIPEIAGNVRLDA